MTKRSSKSKIWLNKQNQDPYIIKSRIDGYRSRAAYKLLEINNKDHILKSGMIVVDLGSAPGGWSQVAAKIVGGSGKVYAIDILPMEPINNVSFIHGDFTDDNIYQTLLKDINNINSKVDIVISDMAPNLTGISSADQANSIYLVELAYTFAKQVFANNKNGIFLAKVFHGAGFDALVKAIKTDFTKLLIRKPLASRSESKEVYLLARGYIGT
jgi:23S rRNA (uridine2552-2'-O)-methyltransferase